MSVLVLSEDEEAARALRSSLSRSGLVAAWCQTVDSARDCVETTPPMVLVADTAIPEVTEFIQELREERPWLRVYLMSDPDGIIPRMTAPLVVKPFDAAQLAELLAREVELAELERGRRSLQAHADELAMLVQASLEAIVGLAEDGAVLSWNRGAETLYGYAASDILGRNIAILEPGEAVAQRLALGSRQVTEVVRRNKAGQEVVVHLSLSPLPRAQHTNLRFSEVSLDVTARRKLVRELEHAERLAGIGRLAASMAHEINNPLAVIRASTAYIGQVAHKTGDLELAEAAEDMTLAAERIGSFVQHVCGFARRERPQLEQAPLSVTLDMALRMLRPRAADRSVTLTLEPFPEVFVAHDPPRLSQAVVNVVANAIDAAALLGGKVFIRVRREPELVALEVEDNGPGLADGIKDTLFEPFTTTKPHGKGTGLGLAITAQIISDHGGQIRLSTITGGGCLARITLQAPSVRTTQVLVLEPDPSIRRVLASTLRASQFEVSTADDLASATELLRRSQIQVLVAQTGTLTPEQADELRREHQGTRLLRINVGSEGLAADEDAAGDVLSGPLSGERLTAAVLRLHDGLEATPAACPPRAS